MHDCNPRRQQFQFPISALDRDPIGQVWTGDVWKAVFNVFDTLKEISDEILFFKNTERGNLIFKIKKDNKKNIVIDSSIPTKNVDGWYQGTDNEWLKYDYKKDFDIYYKNCLDKYLFTG